MSDIREDGTISVKAGATVELNTRQRLPFLYYSGGTAVDPERDIEGLISGLQKIKSRLVREDYTNIRIQARNDCGCRCDCDCRPTYWVIGDRQANDVEIAFYAERDAKQKADQEACERAEFERLSEKFK